MLIVPPEKRPALLKVVLASFTSAAPFKANVPLSVKFAFSALSKLLETSILELAPVVIVPALLKSSTLTLIVELLITPLAVLVNVKILAVASAPEIFPPEIMPEFSKDLFIPLKLIVST